MKKTSRSRTVTTEMLQEPVRWLAPHGELSDIIMTSRVRFARNIEEVPFCHWARREDLSEVLTVTRGAVRRSPELRAMTYLSMHTAEPLDALFLLERHIISQEMLDDRFPSAVLFDRDAGRSVMVNEEDHLRIQVLKPGLDLKGAWEEALRLDQELFRFFPYAYSEEFGYLTSCPTNAGTALRASVMVHLPALVLNQHIEQVNRAIAHLGLAVRGLYGEHTEVKSSFFQVSNQVTLGRTDEEILEQMERVSHQIADYEHKARNRLMKEGRAMIDDKVWRSLGLLRSARLLTFEECMDMLSAVKMGIELGLITGVEASKVDRLLLMIQPAHLQKLCGQELATEEIDFRRAEIVRKTLS